LIKLRARSRLVCGGFVSINKFLDYLLSRAETRTKVLEFLRIVTNDPACRKLKLKESGADDDLMDNVIGQVWLCAPLRNASLAEYLFDPEKKEFAKLFLLCLISSAHPFQPDSNSPAWEPFKEIIDELLVEGMILDPAEEAGQDPDNLESGDVNEYLLQPAGERFIWSRMARTTA
jgi:hypothetical protein